jgi:hypothetical protein
MGFEIIGWIIVLRQNAVLERLVPALDLALGLLSFAASCVALNVSPGF